MVAAQEKPSQNVIKIQFTVNGVSTSCDNPQVDLRVGATAVPVRLVDGEFVVPSIFEKLYQSPETRSRDNIDIHIRCGAFGLDLPHSYAAYLAPGSWEFGVSYPDSWFDHSFHEPQSSEVGNWVMFLLLDNSEPGIVVREAHFDIPKGVPERLLQEQPHATGQRAMEIAFALAVLDEEREKNRDYLLDLFSVCLANPSKPAIEGICDNTRLASMLANLYERGDKSLLRPLLTAAEPSAYVAEELGDFYATSLDRRQGEFLRALAEMPLADQVRVCSEAQRDSFSMDGPLSDRVAKQLRTDGSEVALRCLRTIETAKH